MGTGGRKAASSLETEEIFPRCWVDWRQRKDSCPLVWAIVRCKSSVCPQALLTPAGA